jgi:dolichol kinase
MLSKKELFRGIFHINLGFIIIGISIFLGKYKFLICASIILLAGLLISKISMDKNIPVIGWFLKTFDRDELIPGKGAFSYLLGCSLAIAIFPSEIAYASIIFLALGDGLATLVGKYGKFRHFHSNKTLEGSTFGGVMGAIFTTFIIGLIPSIFASLITMMAESFDFPYHIDDNWLVPLIFGSVSMLFI